MIDEQEKPYEIQIWFHAQEDDRYLAEPHVVIKHQHRDLAYEEYSSIALYDPFHIQLMEYDNNGDGDVLAEDGTWEMNEGGRGMKKQYLYEVDEWSQDTRKWVFTSNRKLRYEELMLMFCDGVHMDECKTERVDDGVSVTYKGTTYGDNSEIELIGDFAEEEEE